MKINVKLVVACFVIISLVYTNAADDLQKQFRGLLLKEKETWTLKRSLTSKRFFGTCQLPSSLSDSPPPSNTTSQNCAGFSVHVNNVNTNPVVDRWPSGEWVTLLDLIYGEQAKRKFVEMDAFFSKTGEHGCYVDVVNGVPTRIPNETYIDIAFDYAANYYFDGDEYDYTLTGVSVVDSVPQVATSPVRCLHLKGESILKWGIGEICKRASIQRYTYPPIATVISACRRWDGRYIVQIRADVNHKIFFHLGNPIPIIPTGRWEQFGIFTGWYLETSPFSGELLLVLAQLDNHSAWKEANCTVADTCN